MTWTESQNGNSRSVALQQFTFTIPFVSIVNTQLGTPAFVLFDVRVIDPNNLNLVVTSAAFSSAAPVSASGGPMTAISTIVPGSGATQLTLNADLDILRYQLRVEGWLNTAAVPTGTGADVHLGVITLPLDNRPGHTVPPKQMSSISLDDMMRNGFSFELDATLINANIGKGVKVTMGHLLLLDTLFPAGSYSVQWGQYPRLTLKVTGPDFPGGVGPTYTWSHDGPIYPLATGSYAPIPLVGGTNSQTASDMLHLNLTAPAVITAQVSVSSYDESFGFYREAGPDPTPTTITPIAVTYEQHDPVTNILGAAEIIFDPNSPAPFHERVSTIASHNGTKTFDFTCDFTPLSETEQDAIITVIEIEVTQTVQKNKSSNAGVTIPARLVEGKETLVRAFLDPGLTDPLGTITDVTGVLTFQMDGMQVSINSLSSMTAKVPAKVQRRLLADTLNFVIPPGFAQGFVQATITPRSRFASSTPFTSGMQFAPHMHLNIIVLPLSVDGRVLTFNQYLQVSNAITKIYPVMTNPSLAIQYFVIPGRSSLPLNHRLAPSGDVDKDMEQWSNLLDELEDIQEDSPSFHKLYAMLPPGQYSLGGKARQDDNVAAGVNVTDSTAHEIGHLYGLKHAPGALPGGPFPDDLDVDFVPSNGTIGEVAVDVESILSATDLTKIVFDTDTGDLMSYKTDKTTTIGNLWIGTYDFEKLLKSVVVAK